MVTMHRQAKWKIAVYGDEPHPLPHYHVEGPGFRCSVDIMTGDVIVGEAPKKVLTAARAWADENAGLLLAKFQELNP
jgi:Domain of unknown function (DUF4160)